MFLKQKSSMHQGKSFPCTGRSQDFPIPYIGKKIMSSKIPTSNLVTVSHIGRDDLWSYCWVQFSDNNNNFKDTSLHIYTPNDTAEQVNLISFMCRSSSHVPLSSEYLWSQGRAQSSHRSHRTTLCCPPTVYNSLFSTTAVLPYTASSRPMSGISVTLLHSISPSFRSICTHLTSFGETK